MPGPGHRRLLAGGLFLRRYRGIYRRDAYMTPVVLLTDGYIANGAEPWMIPDVASLPKIIVNHPTQPNGPSGLLPYQRNADRSRPWAIPGTPGLEHRIGGLEKQDVTGNVSYDPANHEHMVRLRAAKVAGIHPAGARSAHHRPGDRRCAAGRLG